MKKIFSILSAVLLALLISIPAYAAETIGEVPGNAEISVYAKYVDNTGFSVISTDENGSGSITLPDGTEITISGADKASGKVIVEEVTDKEALDWAKNLLGDKADGAKIYYVCVLDENGLSQPAYGITVTIKTKDGTTYTAVALKDDTSSKLNSSNKNGSVTFTTDGSYFYALCRESAKTPGGNSPQTGNATNLALWITLLCVSGSMCVAAVGIRKKSYRK